MNKYNSEAVLHQQVADYIRLRYPNVLFHTDYGSGTKLTLGQAVKQKRLNGGRKAWPDLFIAEARPTYHVDSIENRRWVEGCGLFIELKREGTRIWLKDGSLTKNEHIRQQAEMLDELQSRGYSAEFAIGFDHARQIIDSYLEE